MANANKARGTRTRRNVLHVSKVWGRYRWRLQIEGSPNAMGTFMGILFTPEGMIHYVCDEMPTSYVCLRFVRMALHVAMERGHTFRGGANG